MAEIRTQNVVEHRRSMTMYESDAHIEAVLRFEGLEVEMEEELRKMFDKFCAEIAAAVKESAPVFPGQKIKKVMAYKNGRLTYEEIEK